MKTRQLTMDAMLAAMCAVLGYISLDLGNMKITFESVPILLGALLFGPVDGFLIGGIGTLVYQLLRYGPSATTLLWMLPYALCGLLVGFEAKRKHYRMSDRQIMLTVVLNELLITALNTGVMYIDSKIYGYYSAVYIFGSLVPRIAICIGKAIVFSLVLPVLLRTIHHVFHVKAE